MNLSDPKDCLYCQNNQTLHELMIEIAPLSVSRLFLFKEQTYRGRCLVAYKDHVHDLNMLSDEERNAFMADVVRVTRAMQKVFNPQKINYGAYSDKLSHLHFHLAPKYEGGPDFGGTFTMNPQKVYLTDAEYKEFPDITYRKVCQNLLILALDAGMQKDRPYQSDFYRAGFNAIPRQAREQDSFDTPLTLLMLPCLLTLQTKTSAGNRHFSSRLRTDVRYPYLPFQRNSPYGRLHRNA